MEDLEAVGRLLDGVELVVDGVGEGVDVLAVERRDKALIDGRDHALRPIGAGALVLADLVGPLPEAVEVGNHREQPVGGPAQKVGRLVKHVEELQLARDQAKGHDKAPPRDRCRPRVGWEQFLCRGRAR